MRRSIVLAGMLLLAGSAAIGAPGSVITPDPDTTPMKPMGAEDRAKNGPSALATPPADVGGAPDPDEAPPPETIPAPAPAPAPHSR